MELCIFDSHFHSTSSMNPRQNREELHPFRFRFLMKPKPKQIKSANRVLHNKSAQKKISADTVAQPMRCAKVATHTPVASSSTGKNLRMKLLVDTKARRVLYAEAGKDVVDFFLSLLTLPVATVSSLLTPGSMVGSVGNLYSSVQDLDGTYICRDEAKATLLAPAGGCENVKLLQLDEAEEAVPLGSAVVYRCDRVYSCTTTDYVAEVCGTPCPYCKQRMITPIQVLQPGAGSVVRSVPRDAGTGYVQGIVTYTVMDDLKVTPMSNITGITLLNTYGVTDIGSLQEKTVQLGYAEGLEILKASLQSKTVLTDVFLAKNRKY